MQAIKFYEFQKTGLVLKRSRQSKDINAQLARINRNIKLLDENPDDQDDSGDLNVVNRALNRLVGVNGRL